MIRVVLKFKIKADLNATVGKVLKELVSLAIVIILTSVHITKWLMLVKDRVEQICMTETVYDMHYQFLQR